MPGFRFRLQPLLDQRLEAEERAKEELAERQRELLIQRHAANDLQQKQERIESLVLGLRRELTGLASIGGAELERRKEYLGALAQDLQSARDAAFFQQLVVEEAETKVQQARALVAERSREAETLTRYREKLQKEWNLETLRKEELELDEIGNTLYLNRNRTR
jgi:flagellar export protein FliJ